MIVAYYFLRSGLLAQTQELLDDTTIPESQKKIIKEYRAGFLTSSNSHIVFNLLNLNDLMVLNLLRIMLTSGEISLAFQKAFSKQN